MSDPNFTRSDLCSIRGAVEQAEFAGAVRGPLSTGGDPLTGDEPLASLARDAVRTLFEAGVLRVSGYQDRQHGTGGVCLVTSRRGQRTEAGR